MAFRNTSSPNGLVRNSTAPATTSTGTARTWWLGSASHRARELIPHTFRRISQRLDGFRRHRRGYAGRQGRLRHGRHPLALQLRSLQTLVEVAVEENSAVIFSAPLMSTIGGLDRFWRARTRPPVSFPTSLAANPPARRPQTGGTCVGQ